MTEKHILKTKPSTYLHPKEEPFGPGLELEHIDPPAGALRHALELTVVRKDDQVLPRATEEERVSFTETHTADPTASQRNTLAPTSAWGREEGVQDADTTKSPRPLTSRVSTGWRSQGQRHPTKGMRARRGAQSATRKVGLQLFKDF